MESMSLAPYLVPRARQGYRMGHGQLVDSMLHDGLWDVYGGQHMGIYGDQCATKYKFSKEGQDEYAIRSYTRARKAIAEGKLRGDENVPVRATLVVDGILRDFHIDGVVTLASTPEAPAA